MEMMLQTQNLCKYFRKQKAVNNVSLNIEKGQIYGLLGPNGAGKSTTLKMLTGMMKPTAGKIYFDGKLWDRKDLSKIGALIENPPIYENLSARENLKVRQLLLGADENRIDEVLQIVSLTNTGKKKAGQFSLGMKQRLGIAMALLGEPELLILDEPTNGLDPIGIEELRELIRSFPEQGITVILSSHILSEVQLLADKVGIISGGILGYEGALKQGDNLEDLFMNVVRKTRKQVKSMVNIIKAEHQKAKRTMRKKFIWGFPLLTFVMAFIFTLGMTNAYAESVWNWWYTLLLPGMIALFCYLSVAQEKKIKYYHLMTIPTDRRKLLLGKIIYIGYMILFSNVIVFAGATLGGFLLTTHVPVGGALIAVLFLTVSELWEIPVALFLSERFGMIVNLFVCLFITVSGVVISQTRIWYVLVSAIPMRMMCPLLHVLPNGLAAEAGNPLLDTGVIVPGMCLSIIWFVFVTVLFLKWFERREVK